MPDHINIDTLKRLVALVDQKLDEHRAEEGAMNGMKDYAAWRERRAAANAKLLDYFTANENARFLEKPPHDHSVTMAGIRSSSTMGFDAALKNWTASARKRIMVHE
ncbi:hypothetical protein [Brucella sp. BZ]|uniref:hypothetical protein n=1 Tax=Brucella sp. BZ TaxID=3381346 RepID=UPI0039E99ABD